MGLALASLVVYIKTIQIEKEHYKNKYESIQKELKLVQDESKARQNQLQEDANELTKKYKNTLKDANTLVTENARLNQENIKNAKELRDVKLSLDAIRLFNESKSEDNSTSDTKRGNDGTTTTTKETSVNLQDMLLVVSENDANHIKCIATVNEWQNFWKDYKQKVEAVNARNN